MNRILCYPRRWVLFRFWLIDQQLLNKPQLNHDFPKEAHLAASEILTKINSIENEMFRVGQLNSKIYQIIENPEAKTDCVSFYMADVDYAYSQELLRFFRHKKVKVKKNQNSYQVKVFLIIILVLGMACLYLTYVLGQLNLF